MIYSGSMDLKKAPDPALNPLRAVRLNAGLSLDRLADKAGVSRQLIIRAEQAVYKDPPPTLLRAVLDLDDELDREVVYAGYHHYQTLVRKFNYGRLKIDFKFPVGSGLQSLHPFVEWRLRSGVRARIGPAKLFCVHPALLHKFEVMPWLCQSVPGELSLALRESGYSKEMLAELDQAFYRYKEGRSYRSVTVG